MLSKEIKEKIYKLIAKGETGNAVELLTENGNGDNTIALISSRWKILVKKQIRGTEESQVYTVELNQINSAILEYLSSFKDLKSDDKGLNLLYDYYTHSAVEDYRKNYITAHYQDSVPDETKVQIFNNARKKLAQRFLKSKLDIDKERSKFFFILGDAGMGKSTFIVNFYIDYCKKFTYWGLFPKYNIVLVWLGYPTAFENLKSIPIGMKRNTILLLDALDEDRILIETAQYSSRIKEMIAHILEFKKIIITTRVQFWNEYREKIFKSYLPRLSDGGGDKRTRFGVEKLYLSFFTKEDIRNYLVKKFGKFSSKVSTALNLVDSQHNIFHRPLVLKHIEILMKYQKKYAYNYEVYELLIKEWIQREANLAQEEPQYKVEVERFSKILAQYLYLNNKGSHGCTSEQVYHLARSHDIKLSDFEQVCRSFITTSTSNLLDFSHKSFFEYFLALNLIEDNEFRKGFNFVGFDFTLLLYKEFIFDKFFKPFFENVSNHEVELFLSDGRYIVLNNALLNPPDDSWFLFEEGGSNFKKWDFSYQLLDKIQLIYFENAANTYLGNEHFEKILLSLNRINVNVDFKRYDAVLQQKIDELSEKIALIELHHISNTEGLKNLQILKKQLLSNKKKLKIKFNDSKKLCSSLLNSKHLVLLDEKKL
ncbi:MAG: hypothetical protein RLZZ628_3655 [Bacteroidota bacterium]|jgi:hypothetical protein